MAHYITKAETLGKNQAVSLRSLAHEVAHIFMLVSRSLGASQVALVVKNLPAYAGEVRDVGLIPGLGRSPGGGHGNPLQYSCLGNPMDRGAWWATVHRAAKSRTRLSV